MFTSTHSWTFISNFGFCFAANWPYLFTHPFFFCLLCILSLPYLIRQAYVLRVLYKCFFFHSLIMFIIPSQKNVSVQSISFFFRCNDPARSSFLLSYLYLLLLIVHARIISFLLWSTHLIKLLFKMFFYVCIFVCFSIVTEVSNLIWSQLLSPVKNRIWFYDELDKILKQISAQNPRGLVCC